MSILNWINRNKIWVIVGTITIFGLAVTGLRARARQELARKLDKQRLTEQLFRQQRRPSPSSIVDSRLPASPSASSSSKSTSVVAKISPTPSVGSIQSPASVSSAKLSTSPSALASAVINWQFDGSNWSPSGPAPACPSPLTLQPPVDLSLVSSILYPGQTRGGNYKAHGGFRFDNSVDGTIEVRAPYDAAITSASRYLENNELQYLFEFQISCGVTYRFDHLRTLAPDLQTVANTLPEAKPNDTRTTFINPPVTVKKNQLLASKIGAENPLNIFVDWGVYDLRGRNAAADDPNWLTAHSDNSQAAYGVCWFDWLPDGDKTIVKNLPGSGTEGKTSDYCR